MKLSFTNGFIAGILLTVALLSVVIDKAFVSKDALRLGALYINGKFYKLCEAH